jgi:alkanesulfonate monooxygenase SsuD/methylene tetrahydromethanopterin reductase-like flavin-dependent oxidoreductase (luciferase family)
MPELLMAKAAGLTKQIRMCAAVRLIHLHHRLDVAIQASVTEHLLVQRRCIFGFGSGFPSPLFCEERGLSFDDRYTRLDESLDFILKCWGSDEIFNWDGDHWQGKGVVALPKPLSGVVTASDTESIIKMSAERGYTLLTAFLESTQRLKPKADMYKRYANAVGISGARRNITASHIVYVVDSYEEAVEDLRPAVTHEISVQAERGFLKI